MPKQILDHPMNLTQLALELMVYGPVSGVPPAPKSIAEAIPVGVHQIQARHLHHPPVYMYIRDQTGAREYTYTPTTHREMLFARLRGVGTYQKVPSL